MSRRTERVESLIQIELGELILGKLKDPGVAGLVTVTKVGVAPDLKSARVYYSVMGEKDQKEEVGLALERARGFLQHEIAGALKFRFTPRLSFCLDESVEEGFQIDRIIQHLHQEGSQS